MKHLQGRVVVLTGAAGGIGRATAREFAARGAVLALVDRDEDALTELAAVLAGDGYVVSTHAADVADRARMMALPAEVLAAHGAVHVLVNNAGVSLMSPFEDQPLEDIDWVMGINFFGVANGCKAFLPALRSADAGHIVNIASVAGLAGLPTQSGYCASKAAVIALSESLHTELSTTSVGVTCVMPGTFRTGILAGGRASDARRHTRLVDLMARYAPKPDKVGRAIVSAVLQDTPRVVVGSDARVVDWLSRHAPDLTQRIFDWIGTRV